MNDNPTFVAGNIVRWKGGTKTVGPLKEVAITNGEIRTVVATTPDGRLFLSGRDSKGNPSGVYGSVSPTDVELVR